MVGTKRWQTIFGRTALALALAFSTATVSGCRTTSKDVQRWASTLQGPRKLVAVMSHDKYPLALRVEAAMTLVAMKPRSGRQVGLDRLLDGLSAMTPQEREQIVDAMIPLMDEEIRKPGPENPADGSAGVDTSIPFKDAAFAVLTHEPELIDDQEAKAKLEGSLTVWAQTNFGARMDNTKQKYGMQQVLRHLGAKGVEALPKLITPEETKVGGIAGLIAEVGDGATKTAASVALVDVAKEVNSKAWIERKTPELREANKASGLDVKEAQFNKQLARYQEEELLRTFASMKQVGQKPSVDFLIGFAENKAQDPKRRAAAVAAIEGHLDRKDEAQINKIFSLASADDTPPPVRDQAMRRLGELPRSQVVTRLYELFKSENWRIRLLAAELVLKMSETKHLDEFMNALGQVQHQAMTEPLHYGSLIGRLKGSPAPETLVDKFSGPGTNPIPVRLAALGYYYEHGTNLQLAKVVAYANDRTRVPNCPPDAKDCEWKCEYPEGKTRATKDITTVGEFVTYCVKHAMEGRAPATKKSESKKESNAK